MKKIYSAILLLILLQLSVCCYAQPASEKNKPIQKCPCSLPSVSFAGKGIAISKDSKKILKSIADIIKQDATSVVYVTMKGEQTKSGQRICFARVQKISQYLSEVQNISYDRIRTNCDFLEQGRPLSDANIADFTCDISNEK